MAQKEVHVSTEVLTEGQHKHQFKLDRNTPLSTVLIMGAELGNVQLLPNNDAPLDLLHNIGKHHQVGPALTELDESVGAFLDGNENTNDFGIELVLAIRVNNRWRVAPSASMSPKQILELFGLKHEEYTLYRELSTELLALDTAIPLNRGDKFDAQKDGKYGEGNRA
jgi:hypothetical protein